MFGIIFIFCFCLAVIFSIGVLIAFFIVVINSIFSPKQPSSLKKSVFEDSVKDKLYLLCSFEWEHPHLTTWQIISTLKKNGEEDCLLEYFKASDIDDCIIKLLIKAGDFKTLVEQYSYKKRKSYIHQIPVSDLKCLLNCQRDYKYIFYGNNIFLKLKGDISEKMTIAERLKYDEIKLA